MSDHLEIFSSLELLAKNEGICSYPFLFVLHLLNERLFCSFLFIQCQVQPLERKKGDGVSC